MWNATAAQSTGSSISHSGGSMQSSEVKMSQRAHRAKRLEKGTPGRSRHTRQKVTQYDRIGAIKAGTSI